ncbi:nudix hydrolase 26, chloroplastic isoform X2 [Jatropha curcas]|uniref:nudix hydrolase 26, chloroplastic isoform X2 n=1 Tax=Jatropha curcas TaxID=180498 RepID=UPI0009D679F7|nr:nudix hydrolase 26, chloroplastic isoform X2 [Jatropha curcas]
MAFNRFVFYYSSASVNHLPLPPLRILSKSTLPFLIYPHKLSKFSKLPLSSHNPAIITRTLCLSSPLSSMESSPEGYRRNVGICLINPSKKIFAASRLDIPNAWQMPQGGIDESEDPKTAAIRELKEETGISSAEVLAEAPTWLTYDFPPEVREKLKQQWGSDWKGQAQKWFLLKFIGNEEEINLLGDGTEKPEFGEWSWMSPEQILDLVGCRFQETCLQGSFGSFCSLS